MNPPIDWEKITAPLDVMNLKVPDTYVRRWLAYEADEAGLTFQAQLADETPVILRLDLIEPHIVRFRMSLEQLKPGPPELLVGPAGPPPPFDLAETAEELTVTTSRLRLKFPRFPWQMQLFARAEPEPVVPFFSQRIDDRAYGYTYEVPPTGFERQPDGQLTVREAVAVQPGERFYGFGEKFTALDKWAQELTSWATDSGNVSSHRSYKNVPFFMSSAGYGLFIHSGYPIVYRMGSQSNISYSFHLADSQLDYFLIYGPDFKQILRSYTDLTGRAPVPPKWSFGFWLSRCGYKSRAEVEEVVRQMRLRDFPGDVISLDPWWMGNGPWSTYEWDTEAFPEPAGMIESLRAQGVRTCLWIHPYVPVGTELYAEGLAEDYFVQRPDGQGPAPVVETFTGQELAAVDFTRPAARAWFESKLSALLDMGVAVFKSDFGEQSPVEACYHDGRSGLEMHNLYPLLYNRSVFELTERTFGRGLTWGRAGYAGSQRYPVQWGGDSYSSLDQLASQLRGLLSYGLSGVPFCSHDVGGFDYSPRAFDYPSQEEYPKDAVTYIRWLQMGIFSSHLRAHGKQPREPWSYGPQVEAIARRYLKLRYRLLPYIYSEAVRSSRSGLPMVRPLVLDYPADSNTYQLDWQYLFGRDLLVAPIFSRSNRTRVYLPEGEWLDYWSRTVVTGGRWLTVEAPLEMLPLWIRAGAIIPLGPTQAYVGEKPLDPLTLALCVAQAAGETVIYDEDRPEIGVSYRRQGAELEVMVDPTPGQLELVLYGVRATSVRNETEFLAIHDTGGGQLVRCNGQAGTVITFTLETEE